MEKIKIRHPAVFIFGAGATRGGIKKKDSINPPPVDIDFFDICGRITERGTPRIAQSVLRSVWELYGRTHKIGLEQYYRDIETREKILTFAHTGRRKKEWDKRKESLNELIRRVLIQTTCKDVVDKPYKPIVSIPHQKILRNLDKTDTIITFNYDLVIEESFDKETSLWNPVIGYGTKVNGKTFDWCKEWLSTRKKANAITSSINLLKLHGSINWKPITSSGRITLKHRPYNVRKNISEKVEICPPGWNKRIDIRPYGQLWKTAKDKLEKCNSLVVLGYSLPETDLLAHALFSEVVRKKKDSGDKKLKRLHNLCLIDPKSEVREKFINMFAPALTPNAKIYNFNSVDEFGDFFGKS